MSSLFAACGLLHFHVRAESYAQLVSCDVWTLLRSGVGLAVQLPSVCDGHRSNALGSVPPSAEAASHPPLAQLTVLVNSEHALSGSNKPVL